MSLHEKLNAIDISNPEQLKNYLSSLIETIDEQKDDITSLENEKNKLLYEVQLLKEKNKQHGTIFVKKLLDISGYVDIQSL